MLSTGPSRRRLAVLSRAGLAALALLVLAWSAVASSGVIAHAESSAPPAGTTSAASISPPSGPAVPVLTPMAVEGATAPAPTPKGVRSAVGSIATAAGLGRSGATVIDPDQMGILLDVHADRALVPGSVVKLTTAAAALTYLGPQARIATTVVASGPAGDVITLVGGGDTTLSMRGGEPGVASLADLATQVAAQVQAGPVDLRYDDALFTGPDLGPGWGRDYPSAGVAAPVTALMVDQGRVRPGASSRVSDPARDAAKKFRKLLEANGVTVRSLKRGRAPEGATEIGRVESAPVSYLVEAMLTESDNDLAEALAHLAGAAAGYQASFAGGATAATKALVDLGVQTGGLHLVDGSGVSARNRASATTLAQLLAVVARGSQPALSPIASGLAVAGFSGTLEDRFNGANHAAAGYVRAKTGTLTGVTALAGLVPDTSGRLLVFALLANDIGSIDAARSLGDDFAARLAACGCN